MASQDCDNVGVNMQNPHAETKTVTNTNCNNDERGSEWRNDALSAEVPNISSLGQSATCIVANCRSRLKAAPSHTSASLTTPETIKDLAQSKTFNVVSIRRFTF